jgi:succinate dehydrogenase / fumarate reductase cytochrome b subunit
MTWFTSFYKSAVGKKAVMAITGIVLFGFVVGHVAGNLKAFAGPVAFDEYAAFLRDVGAPAVPHHAVLWTFRVVLLAAVALHVHASASLVLMARRARPTSYSRRDVVQLDYAARTMRWGGVIILLYVVYHLLHLTWGTVHPDFRPPEGGSHHAYYNLVVGLANPVVSGVYALASLVLGFHLYHGLWSMFQSLGWNHPRYNRWRRGFAIVFAIAIAAGFFALPVAVQLGVLELPSADAALGAPR